MPTDVTKITSCKMAQIIERAKQDARTVRMAHPYVRYGQAFMNALPLKYSAALTGHDADPYNDDTRMAKAEAYLYRNFTA